MRACLLQMPVWVSYVQSTIYTKPPGYFFKVCHLCFCPFLSSLRCQTPTWASSVSCYNNHWFLYLSFSPLFSALGSFSEIPSRPHYGDVATDSWGKYNSKGCCQQRKDNNAPHINANIFTASFLSPSDNLSHLLWGEHDASLSSVQYCVK